MSDKSKPTQLYRVALPAEILFDVAAPAGLSEEHTVALARDLLERAIDREGGFKFRALKNGRVYPGLQDTMSRASSTEDWRVVDITGENGD